MKKLLFTAMAVLAFSGVSFAKTGEVETNIQPLEYGPCVTAAATAYGMLVGYFGEDGAMKIARAVEDACEEARQC